MVRRDGSVVLVSLVLAVVIGGCAAQQSAAHDPSAIAAMDSTVMTAQDAGGTGATDATGGTAALSHAARPRPGDFTTVAEVSDVLFEFDRYDIRPETAKVLDVSAQWLRTHPDALLLIEGHTDERGTNEYNVTLGERRAKASMTYLVSHGIKATRMTIVSYGEERPVCSEKAEGCWSKNRRAHFLVTAR
jgi:peptidoglycan-associated lipoprotein